MWVAFSAAQTRADGCARGVGAMARRRLGTPADLSDQGRRHRSWDGRTQERPGARRVRSRRCLVAAGSFSIPRYRGRPAHGVAMSISRNFLKPGCWEVAPCHPCHAPTGQHKKQGIFILQFSVIHKKHVNQPK